VYIAIDKNCARNNMGWVKIKYMCVKIGCTKNLEQRLIGLNRSTNSMNKFRFKYKFAKYVKNHYKKEKELHKALKGWRVKNNREFFDVPYEELEKAKKNVFNKKSNNKDDDDFIVYDLTSYIEETNSDDTSDDEEVDEDDFIVHDLTSDSDEDYIEETDTDDTSDDEEVDDVIYINSDDD